MYLPWAGRIARLNQPTIDGRLLVSAFWLPPLPVMSEATRQPIGTVDGIQAVLRFDGYRDILAVGWINLRSSVASLPVGVDVVNISDVDLDQDTQLLTIARGEIRALTVYDDDGVPAWPGCEIQIFRG